MKKLFCLLPFIVSFLLLILSIIYLIGTEPLTGSVPRCPALQ